MNSLICILKNIQFLCQIQMISSQNEWPSLGEYIDFRDKDNNPWQVGLVISKAKNIIKVRSQGWSSKLDELVQITSGNRIKPFRSLVRGYTGQVKNPALREHWKFNKESQQQQAQNFRKFLEQQGKKNQNEIKQFLRGSHYFWIDFLLTITYSSSEDLELAYQYLKEHIRFTCKYIKQICEAGISNWCNTDNLQANVKAYRESYYEVLDAIHLLTGSNVRQLDFQKNNDKNIRILTDGLTHEKYFTKYMVEAELDICYVQLVSQLQKELAQNKVIPIPFLYEFFHIFSPIQKAINQKTEPPFDVAANNKQQRKKLAVRILNIIKNQFQYLVPAQLKSPQNQKQIDQLFLEIRATYFRLGLQQIAFQWVEKTKLKIASLLIQTDSLERKLKGIAKLKELHEIATSQHEFKTFKLNSNDFTIFLKDNKIVQSLYENNQHPQILKKGSELCQLFLKSHFIEISSIISIWQTCSHKHEAVRKVIYQLWVQVLPMVNIDDIGEFVKPILESCLNSKQDQISLFIEQWQLEILFNFVYNLVKQFQELSKDRQQLDSIITQFIDIMYNKLILIESSNQIKVFVSSFTRLINATIICNKIIKQIYQSIAKNLNLNLNLQLLMSFYQQSFEKQTVLPANALQIIFFTFQSPKNHYLSPIIFQLMDEILNFSSNIAGCSLLTLDKFANLWTISQQKQGIKSQFYSWLIKKNSDGLFGKPVYEINQCISHELRSAIFNNFICDHNKFDYFNMSLQQLSIFKQFLIFENDVQNRIELKRLMTMIKIVRIKNIEIIGNKTMWDIFLNCKNEQVIKQLSKIIINFYFHYSDNIEMKIKKNRINNLLIKLQKHIKDGFKKGNLKLMKHSLILLKDIIDYIKQKNEPKEIINNYQQYFKTVIKIFFQNKKYDLEIFFGITYYDIKTKISQLIKLQRTKFEMFSLKNQEISLEFSSVPFCFMQEKTIKVIRVDQKDETISSLVLNFMKDRIENTLIDMLQDDSICENVYKALQDIQINIDEGQILLQKLIKIIDKHQKLKKQQSSKNEIYVYLFYIRVLLFMIEKPKFLEKYTNSNQFLRLIQKLQINITNDVCIIYLYNLTQVMEKILKSIKQKQIIQNIRQIIRQKIMKIIQQVNNYINNNKIEQKQKFNMKKVRIIFNCLNIIQEIQKTQNAIHYIINHHRFIDIVHKIYAYDNISEIRLIFCEKIRKFLIKNRQAVNKNQKPQDKIKETALIEILCKIFISSLYYKLRTIQGNHNSNKKSIYFYRFIINLIPLLNPQQFQTYVMGNQHQPRFYQDVLSNLRNLHDSSQPTASTNHILEAHLNILTSIYKLKPHLMDQKILAYILYQCLFYREGVSAGSDLSCKKAESIKAALQVIQAGCLDYSNPTKLIQIIKYLTQVHKLDYWRTSDNWSTVIENEVKSKYVGLQNPGCICYLNSLLQQLFMTNSFRQSILGLNLQTQQQDKRLQMLRALKQLFLSLMLSQQIAINPLFFTKTIKSHDNKPIVKIFMQMDIDQFCSILFDRIEQQLVLIKDQPNIVKNIFGGTYAHQIISKQCTHSSQRQQQFISIGLQVKKSVLQSFNALIKGQMLDGENKYHCQKCDKKVKAEKILTIKKFPQNLILSIKRFQYNYEIDAKIKINDYCQFPPQLNLKKYSQQEINHEANIQNGENVGKQLPDSYFKYKLKGVVVHTGSADSGHYYSFIEDGDKSWFEFNDSHVSPFDYKNLQQQAFGSKDAYEQKVKNAYLLFYQRIVQQQVDKVHQQRRQNKQIINKILNKNKTINKFRLLFSKDYSNFITSLMNNIDKFDLPIQQQNRWPLFVLTYYLLIKIREGSLDDILDFSVKIQKLIEGCPIYSQFFLQSLNNFNFLEQIYVYGSNRQKVKVINSLLLKSFINIYKTITQPSLKDTFVNKLLVHIKYLISIHGNIYQLELFIISILDYTKNQSDHRIYKLLIYQLSFQKYLLTHLFNLPITKQQKDAALLYKEQQKRLKNIILSQGNNQGKKYIPSITKSSWHLISYFIEYLQPDNIVQTQEEEEQDQLKGICLILDKVIKSGNLPKIIHDCGTPKAVYWLYKTFKSVDKTAYLLQSIQKGLKDYESTKYRPLLILLNLILIDKETPNKIIKNSIDALSKVLAVNDKYFLQVNLIHQWILKISQASTQFLKVLLQNYEFIDRIILWIHSKAQPSSQLIKKHKSPTNQRLLNRLNGILVSADPKDYHNLSRYLKKKFTNIRESKQVILTEHLNWQKEHSDEFKIGQQAFYYQASIKRWIKVKIIQNNFGYLKIEQVDKEKKTEIRVWDDNQRISCFKQLKQQQDLQQQSSQEIEPATDVIEQQQDLYN